MFINKYNRASHPDVVCATTCGYVARLSSRPDALNSQRMEGNWRGLGTVVRSIEQEVEVEEPGQGDPEGHRSARSWEGGCNGGNAGGQGEGMISEEEVDTKRRSWRNGAIREEERQ